MKPHFLGNCLHCGAKPGFPHHKRCSSLSKNRPHYLDLPEKFRDEWREAHARWLAAQNASPRRMPETVPQSAESLMADRIKSSVDDDILDDVRENAGLKDPAAHYRRAVMKVAITDEDIARGYVEVSLDPYRIAKEHDMRGGPREQIMKKTLRFTHKGDTEAKVVADIRAALERWEMILEEDERVPCNT